MIGGSGRLHGNYPHHRAALLVALGVRDEDVRSAVAERGAIEVEDAVVAAGGCAAAVRDEAAWAAHPHGAAIAAAQLLDFALGARPAPGLGPLLADALPAAGVRVLDLTRVIAGPVGTRMLGALGADVLRIDPPWLPELAERAVGAVGAASTASSRPRPASRPRAQNRARTRPANCPRKRSTTAPAT